MAGFNVPLDTL